MGLAASQARFLCITARKADCEYKSTALAQEKLNITKQLSDISTQYAQAMNATKLIWQNDALSGNFGVTYSLLMMPTAANDYNPYMITSPSGAIVLNSEYAAAAKAAGISKAGGVGSQTSRDKFIAALSYQGLITEPTANAITVNDYVVNEVASKEAGRLVLETSPVADTRGVTWNPAAGMGADPLTKSAVEALTLPQLLLTETIGQDTIDWATMFVDPTEMTEKQYDEELERLSKIADKAKNRNIDKDVVDQLKADYNQFINNPGEFLDSSDKPYIKDSTAYYDRILYYEDMIRCAENITSVDAAGDIQYEGVDIRVSSLGGSAKSSDWYAEIQTYLVDKYDAFSVLNGVGFDIAKKENEAINVSKNVLNDDVDKPQYSVVQDGVINHYADELKNMTIADILTSDVVLITNPKKATELNAFKDDIMELFDSIVETLGYSKSKDMYGQGLYVDDAARDALAFAYNMIQNTYLKVTDVQDVGSRRNNKSLTENSAYLNAINSNRIGSDDKNEYYAVSLTNMLSAFLTYFDNGLASINSPYVVGTTAEMSNYVTEDLGYYYMAQTNEDAVTSIVDKSADFYDQVYNNILEHGWREDSSIDDNEYLEEALKDGRYSMSSLNNDGYYYQTRYNETGYMVEVSDTDAIERAEAEFSSMKAQLTYKEDSIDMKTKKLDAEISALSTEYDTVKNLITKSIEKTFSMFQN